MFKLSFGYSLLLVTIISACSMPQSRYQDANDSKPDRLPSVIEMQDAIPHDVKPSRGGNRDYEVRGKSYQVLKSAKSFSQVGIASWYGKKFHGHLTSNGEIYDMYAMSAAHKKLPLPTYLRVTNVANNKSVIVRVNDRGPFHQNRIIDLSYSAAHKLDMLKTGTAKVKITTITKEILQQEKEARKKARKKAEQHKIVLARKQENVKSNKNTITSSPLKTNYLIQVFATKSKQLAHSTAVKLAHKFKQPVITPFANGIYRVQLGPFIDNSSLSAILRQLKKTGYPNAYRKKQT